MERFAGVIEAVPRSDGEFQPLKPNPYITGGPIRRAGSKVFVGREDVFEFLARALQGAEQDNVVLQGQRRTGKTSLLYQLKSRLTPLGHLPVIFDASGFTGEGMAAFLCDLTYAVVDQLAQMGYEVEEPPAPAFGRNPGTAFRRDFLRRVFAKIPEDSKLLLMLDEFEAAETRIKDGKLEPETLEYIRSLMQHTDRLSFIFAGTHELRQLTAAYWSIFFNNVQYRRIGLLDTDGGFPNTRKLIIEPTADHFEIDELAIEAITEATGGHPYFTQLLCHRLVGHCNKLKDRYVTNQHVRDVIETVVEAGEYNFGYIWNTSAPPEKAMLLILNDLMIHEGVARLEDVREHPWISHLGGAEALDIIKLLGNKDIVSEPTQARYCFKVGLIQRWIDKEKDIVELKGTAT